MLLLVPSNLTDLVFYYNLKDWSVKASETDILRMRKTTTGIFEGVIPFKNICFRLIDVGGLRD